MSLPSERPRKSKSSTPVPSTKSGKSEHHKDDQDARKRRFALRRQRRIRYVMIGRFIRISLYVVLAVGLLVFVTLALTVAWDIGTTSSVLSNTWRFHPIPVTYPFEEFAVSSSSEVCNELARILRVEGHTFFGVATAVMICLAVTEPNRNSLDDPGVAVFVDMKKKACQQTSSVLMTSSDSLQDHEKHFLRGKTFHAIFSRVDPVERATLKLKLIRRFRNYPVSNGLADYIYKLGAALHFIENYGQIFYNDVNGSILREGDIFVSKIPDIFRKLKQVDLNDTDVNLSESDGVELTELEKYSNDAAMMDSRQNINEGVWLNISSIPFADNRSVCGPLALDGSSAFLEILPSFPDRARVEREISFGADRAKVTAPLYVTAYRILWPLVHRLRRIFISHHHHHHHHHSRRREKKISSPGNFFTILDRTEQLAIAFSGSRRVEREDYENDKDQSIQYSFQPLIVYNNDQIETLWAGPGGLLEQSLEIPRMAYALLFNVILRIPLERAVATPLFFPYGKIAYYTEGISWVGVNELRDNMNVIGMSGQIMLLPKNSKLFKMDTASAIEIRQNGTFPVFFDRGGLSIIPNGL